MDIEKLLKSERKRIYVDESEIQSVVNRSRELFLEGEKERQLSYHEFIGEQLRMIRKRWWIYQFVLLCFAWQFLAEEHELFYIRRGMGVFATLFTILLIPELWKNITNRCMEIEIASYYSLNQIYAARILLFTTVDVFLLTIFGAGAHCILQIPIIELITQFLLPIVVTAWICFMVLGKHYRNAGLAIGLCIAWGTVWWIIVSDDNLYSAVSTQIWLAVFIGACLLLLFTISHLLRSCDKYMEVNLDGTIVE